MALFSHQFMASTENSSPHHSSRQALVPVVMLAGWILFLYRDAVLGMVQIWSRSETFTHGFLVPPIVLWMLWRARGSLLVKVPAPSAWVLLAVGAVAFAWLMADLAAVNSVTQLAVVALLVLIAPVVLGVSSARLIIFPLCFLFFAVPIGEVFLPQLMEWTADFTVLALRLSGVPVFREGLQFVIPSGNWSVVEACSGVRYLIASFTVGTLFAYLNYQSTQRRLLFMVVSILVPIVANWVRAYMIVMLGHLSGNKLAVGVDHLIYGWVFFGIVIMMMFAIGIRWAEPEPEPAASNAGLAMLPETEAANLRSMWIAAVCFGLLVATPQVLKWATAGSAGESKVSMISPDALGSSWTALRTETPDELKYKPVYQFPAADANTIYQNQDARVGLFLAFYRNQDYERKLVTSNNVLVTSSGGDWTRVSSGSRDALIGSERVSLKTMELRGSGMAEQTRGARLLVWQIYWINGTLTSNDYLAKAYSALYRLMGRGDDSAVIVVYTAKDASGKAEAALESFVTANYAAIADVLTKTRAQK